MKRHEANFRFYEELNDFLPREKRKKPLAYTFSGTPSVKDAIEAWGVPHTEIEIILVNGVSVDFTYRLRNDDRVAVYPVFESMDVSPLIRLRPEPLRILRFATDEQLGRLTKYLRLLGFDTDFVPSSSPDNLIERSIAEKRIILTRDRKVLKNRQVTRGYWVRSADPHHQIIEVIRRFDLTGRINAFTRCLVCNGMVHGVAKKIIARDLPERTRNTFDRFRQCGECGRVYWEGSHYDRLKENISRWMAISVDA